MFPGFSVLLRIKIRSSIGAFQSHWESRRLRVIAGAVTIAVFLAGAYFLFSSLFGYLLSLEDQDFGIALSQRLLSAAFLAFCVFLAVSSIITGLSTLFRSTETSFLLTLPEKGEVIGIFKTLESWFYAGWATLLLGIPLLSAYGVSWNRGLLTLPVALFFLFPLVLVSVSVGTFILFLLTSLGSIKKIWRVVTVGILTIGLVIILVLSGMSPEEVIISESTSSLGIPGVQRFVSSLPSTGSSFWPHQVFTSLLTRLAYGDTGGVLIKGILLWVQAIFLCCIALFSISRDFRRKYSRLSNEPARFSASRLLQGRFKSPLKAMIRKDIILFFRDTVQYSQLGLLGAMFIVYASNLHKLPINSADPVSKSVLVFLNISFTGFVMATLLVRFAFPSISLEFKGLPVILSSPGGRKLLFTAKWIPSFVGILLPMEAIGIASVISINAGNMFMLETVVSIAVMTIVLVSINIGLGAVYPEFGDNNAAHIASGQGGIISAFVSMGFVLFLISVLSFVTRRYMSSGIYNSKSLAEYLFTGFLIIIPVAVVVSFLFTGIAFKNLKKRDF